MELRQKLHLILPIVKKRPVLKGGRSSIHSIVVVVAMVVVPVPVIKVVVVGEYHRHGCIAILSPANPFLMKGLAC